MCEVQRLSSTVTRGLIFRGTIPCAKIKPMNNYCNTTVTVSAKIKPLYGMYVCMYVCMYVHIDTSSKLMRKRLCNPIRYIALLEQCMTLLSLA